MTELNDNQKTGVAKIVSGIVLIIAGILGFVFGRNIRERAVRLIVMILSAASFGTGFYLFVDGMDDLAIGRVGNYTIGGEQIQGMAYEDAADFEKGITLTQNVHHAIRRLHFKCPDNSQAFTVYLTYFGAFGLPSQSVVCKDGFKLLSYTQGSK